MVIGPSTVREISSHSLFSSLLQICQYGGLTVQISALGLLGFMLRTQSLSDFQLQASNSAFCQIVGQWISWHSKSIDFASEWEANFLSCCEALVTKIQGIMTILLEIYMKSMLEEKSNKGY